MAVVTENKPTIYLGTEVKFSVKIEASGFDMSEDEWSVTLKKSAKTLTVTKDAAVYDADDDAWYITFDTSYFGVGTVYAVVTAQVPDEDFEDGLRTEVEKSVLCQILSV